MGAGSAKRLINQSEGVIEDALTTSAFAKKCYVEFGKLIVKTPAKHPRKIAATVRCSKFLPGLVRRYVPEHVLVINQVAVACPIGERHHQTADPGITEAQHDDGIMVSERIVGEVAQTAAEFDQSLISAVARCMCYGQHYVIDSINEEWPEDIGHKKWPERPVKKAMAHKQYDKLARIRKTMGQPDIMRPYAFWELTSWNVASMELSENGVPRQWTYEHRMAFSMFPIQKRRTTTPKQT